MFGGRDDGRWDVWMFGRGDPWASDSLLWKAFKVSFGDDVVSVGYSASWGLRCLG